MSHDTKIAENWTGRGCTERNNSQVIQFPLARTERGKRRLERREGRRELPEKYR